MRKKQIKKLRIAFVVNNFPAVSEPFILNRMIALINKGHDIAIYSYDKRIGDLNHGLVDQHNLIEKCNYYKIGELRRIILFFLQFFEKICKKVNFFPSKLPDWFFEKRFALRYDPAFWFKNDTNSFDAIEVHYGFNAVPLAYYKSKGHFCTSKLIVTFHGCDLIPSQLSRYKIAYKMVFDHFDAITVNSPYLKELMCSICKNKEKVYQVPMGIMPAKFLPDITKHQTAANNDFIVLFVGRLIDWKGPDLAIEIINELVKERGYSNIHLRIVGDGNMKEQLANMISNYGLEQNVYLAGSLSQEMLFDEFAHAKVFLLPGLHNPITGRAETQGLVIQEAQSMEVPVVVSDAGGMKYGLIDGKTGFVVKQKDAKGFADKIEYLVNNESVRMEMGKAGRSFIIEHFDSHKIADTLLDIYKK